MKVLGDISSGNCYKVKLTLAQLGIQHQWEHIDILKGETRSERFLRLNPNGKIPVLVLDSGEVLTESNAIINYIAEGTPLLPSDRLQRARVLEWQFFEQYSHEPFVAVARFIHKYLGMPEERLSDFESKKQGRFKALRVMEAALEKTPYLIGNDYAIADISLYAYIHVADESGFDLTAFPAIEAWLARVGQQPGRVTMAQFQ